MRKLLIVIVVALVLLVAAVVVVPRVIGTEQLTAFLTERLRTATGYNVAIRGPVSLSVLPSPSLSVADIHVTAAATPGAPELARAGAVQVEVALMPLFGGRVEATAVTVRDPVVMLEGPLGPAKPVAQAPAKPAPSPGPAPGAPQGTTPGQAPAGAPQTAPSATSKFSVAVEHVRVTNGSVTYRDGGQTYTLEHLDLDVTTSPGGAVSGSADAGFGQDRLHVVGRVGALDCAKAIPLSLHATADAGRASLDFDGTAGCGADGARAGGKLKLAADSARAALTPFTAAALPAALDRRLALEGTLDADPGRLDLADLSVDFDESHGIGTLNIRTAAHDGERPAIDLALDVNRLDLAPWFAPPPAGRNAAAPSAPAVSAATGMPNGTSSGAPSAMPRGFAALHIGLDLSVELLAWHDGLIRQARFNGGIDQGTVTINQATAELPGGTDMSVSGQVADAFGIGHFTGTADAETDNLRALCDWAGLKFGGVPADRLRQASLSTTLDVVGDPAGERVSATGIELELDGSQFKGAANLVLGDRPGIGLRLAGDQLNLDAYLAGETMVPLPQSGGGQAAVSAGPSPTVATAAALLPLVAANLDLSFDKVTWRGQLLKAVHLAGLVDRGAVELRDARIGDLGGGSLALSGRWSGGLGTTATLTGRVTAGGPSAVPLLTFLGLGGQETAGRLGAYTLDLRAQGQPLAPGIDATLTAEEARGTAKGRLALGAAPHFVGTATLDHPEAARLLAIVAPLYRPAGGALGAVQLAAAVDADPQHLTLDQLSLTVGEQRVAGTLSLDGTAHPARLDADLTGGDLVFDPFLPARESAAVDGPVRYAALGDPGPLPGHWSRAKFDLSWLSIIDAKVKLTADSAAAGPWHFDKPVLGFALKGGTLGLDTLMGGLFGGKIDAHGSLSQAGAAALTLAGRDLDLKDLAQQTGAAALTAGKGQLDADLTANGTSEADLIAALGGKASLSARDGALTGFDLPAVNDRLKALKGPQDLVAVIQAVQAGGSTRFTALDATATIAGGVIRSNEAHLAADGGDLTAQVTANLPAWTIEGKAALALAGRTDLPPIAMSFDGPLDKPEKRIDVNSLAAYAQRQGVGSLLQGLTGQQAAPASPSQQPQQQKPAQQLQDLFKGLLPKKP
ncbi:hypothetical protein GCM10011611_24340 [Aliidongia dinghuensis]|uniref:AsmA domain-containing protein n=1 Tax=Aliidongia dinghuensis TaxID=1867774 RepID=A0A8J2YTY8_9PROT|nr:AsmA family protein [Aliidongia dinghuensis]GGF17606.1 hypothetical protein GCM10011611_24340 [Aliidongia dinghuensis]